MQVKTYIPDKILHMCVTELARYNKEIKISGQNKNDFNPNELPNRDPRKIPNSVELETEIGREFKEKREKELQYRNQEKQTPTKHQLEWDKAG